MTTQHPCCRPCCGGPHCWNFLKSTDDALISVRFWQCAHCPAMKKSVMETTEAETVFLDGIVDE